MAASFLPPKQHNAPVPLKTPPAPTRNKEIGDKNINRNEQTPSPSTSIHSADHHPLSSNTNKILMEEAIRAQALAEAEISNKNLTNDNSNIYSTPKQESSVSFAELPPSHADKVARLLEERNNDAVNARAKILSKKKQDRLRTKALMHAEKEQKIAEETRTKDSVNVGVRAVGAAAKMKGKNDEARRQAEKAALAEAKILEEEEAAKMRALLRSKALARQASQEDPPPNLTYKEFHVQKAKEKAKLESEQVEQKPALESLKPSDDKAELLNISDLNVDDMTADELFQAKIKQSEMKEKQLMREARSGSRGGRSRSSSEEKQRPLQRMVQRVASTNGSDDTVDERRERQDAKTSSSAVEETKGVKEEDEDSPPPHIFDKYFRSLKEKESGRDVMAAFESIKSNSDLNQSSLHALESDELLMTWVDNLFTSILRYKEHTTVVLVGLSIAAMFPFDRLSIPHQRVGFCGIISKLLSAHIDSEDYCADVLHYGAKFTSKKTVYNLEQAVDNEGLEIMLKVLMKYGQQKDVIGNAPKVVLSCLKYIRNICMATSEFAHGRLMAAGVGSCLVKLLVFYRTDEGVVVSVCRCVASLVKNTAYLTQFASLECIHLYMLILKTNPMNKVIAKAVGVLLIEVYTVDPEATKEVFLKIDFANLLNSLLVAQMDLTSRFSLSVIECNIMMASFFIIQVAYLKEEFLRLDVVSTLHEYQQNQQNFGNNIDIVIQKCLKHLTST